MIRQEETLTSCRYQPDPALQRPTSFLAIAKIQHFSPHKSGPHTAGGNEAASIITPFGTRSWPLSPERAYRFSQYLRRSVRARRCNYRTVISTHIIATPRLDSDGLNKRISRTALSAQDIYESGAARGNKFQAPRDISRVPPREQWLRPAGLQRCCALAWADFDVGGCRQTAGRARSGERLGE